MTFRSRSPLSHEASVPQRPPGVVVQDAGIAGSCSQSRLSSQRGAARRALGAIATAQGDAEAAGSGERRGRRGEGRCHAKGERRGQAGAKDGMSQAPGVQPNQQPSVYHERQRLELCAVHALNNVLQQQLFNQEAADEICKRPLSQLALPQVLGLILNLPSPVSLGLLSLPLRRRHWVALRQVNGIYYNLDSKLRAPEPLGDEDGVRAFLEAALAQGLCEVLLVVTKEVEEKGCWLRAG
ncbi:josephin-2 isoform X16 [Nycticebus coucang]|uniref:josephin-2 isoform X16 n=1 Tax=Nycticebus coucang TaxID=9470 RepID=UPI00234D7800|nr:josephin-2 isoform X16 [Nycticebus coucang]